MDHLELFHIPKIVIFQIVLNIFFMYVVLTYFCFFFVALPSWSRALCASLCLVVLFMCLRCDAVVCMSTD